MSKSWWFNFRVGLFNDPKHRAKMGSAIWLYGYLHGYADRDTGKLVRKYETIASEIGASTKTVQRWMLVLRDKGYVKLCRLQYGLSIQITKWEPIKTGKRPDNIDRSKKTRVDNSGVQIGHFEDSDRTTLSRPDNLVRSVNGSKDYHCVPHKTNVSGLKKGFKESLKRKKDILSGKPDFALKIISFLNREIGSKYQPGTSATKRLIEARRKEGFTLKDFEAVITKKSDQWKGDSEMAKFLRPETLFGTKFESYLNEPSNGNGREPELTESERLARQKRCDAADLKFEKSMGLAQ